MHVNNIQTLTTAGFNVVKIWNTKKGALLYKTKKRIKLNMKIALLTETYLPYINGVVTHVSMLKDGLEKLGHTVLVVTADHTTRRHYIKDGVMHCPAVRFKRIYNFGVAMPVSRKRVKLLREFNPDIIHIHNEFGIGLWGISAAKTLKKPLVYTLHTMYDEYLYYIAPRKLINLARRFSHKYTGYFAKRAAALTGPSKKCSEYFIKSGISKQVNVIPNSVELESFLPENIKKLPSSEIRKKYGIGEHILLTCFVGRLGKEKSVDVLLDYWAKSVTPKDNIMLMIIGDGPTKIELEEQAQALGISSMVVFAGKVQHCELPPYYAECDAYITASLSDTNSISMLEGMAAGLPVFSRLDRLNEDQVIENENGFIFRDAEEMGIKLRQLRDMNKYDVLQLKKRVSQSVTKSGCIDLATNVLFVYEGIIKKK